MKLPSCRLSGHPRPFRTSAVWVVAGLCATAGCSSAAPVDGEPATTQAAPQSAKQRGEPIRLTEVPPPPGIDPRVLSPVPDELRELATRDLDAILAEIDKPAFLTAPEGEAPADEPRDDTALPRHSAPPPLAAQRLYASGRQAFRTGDNFLAVQQFEKALRLAPKENAILSSLGRAWAVAGNRVSASNYLRQAFEADRTDLDSLLLLGRFALENRQWDEAISILAAARDLAAERADSSDADPADPPLIQFLMANALTQVGYGSAAVEAYRSYLEAPRIYTRSTPHGRELMVIDAQRDQTLVQLGDLHHRLDEPEAAAEAYELATEPGQIEADDLLRRLVYTRLRLGQTRAAGDLAVRAALGGEKPGGTILQGDATSMTLVRYAVEHGADASRIADALRERYTEEGRPPALAMVIADALPRAEASALLSEHLAEKPGDVEVFGRLIRLLLGEDKADVRPEDRIEAVRVTAAAMAEAPASAKGYAAELIEQSGDAASLLPAFDAETLTGPDTPHPAEIATLHGLTLLTADQPDAAADAFRHALELDPDQSLARIELAAMAVQREDYEQADKLLEPLADIDDPRVAALRVRALVQTGQDDAALKLIDEMMRGGGAGAGAGTDDTLALDKARLLLKLDRIAEAEQTLLDALNAQPTNEAIYELLLTIYNDHSEMMRNYQRLIRRMIDTIPRARVTQLELARLQIASSDFAAAEKSLDRVLAMDADDFEAQQLLLELYIRTQRTEAAGRMIDAHLDADDGVINEELLQLAEVFFRRMGDQARSLKLAEKRLLPQPVSLERNLLLAAIYFDLERYDDVIAIVREGLDAGLPHDEAAGQIPATLTGLYTAALIRLDPQDQATDRLREAMKLYPQASGDLAYTLAMLYEERGEPEAGYRVMEEALADHPDNAQLNNALGYAWANAGLRLDDAERMIGKALAAEPEQAAYLDSLGWVYYKRGRFAEAVEQLRRARAQPGGTHPVIMDHLGDALFRLGREAEAVQIWREAQQAMTQPDFTSADPESVALPEKLKTKLNAVEKDEAPPLAEVVADEVSFEQVVPSPSGVENPQEALNRDAPIPPAAMPAASPPDAPAE